MQEIEDGESDVTDQEDLAQEVSTEPTGLEEDPSTDSEEHDGENLKDREDFDEEIDGSDQDDVTSDPTSEKVQQIDFLENLSFYDENNPESFNCESSYWQAVFQAASDQKTLATLGEYQATDFQFLLMLSFCG